MFLVLWTGVRVLWTILIVWAARYWGGNDIALFCFSSIYIVIWKYLVKYSISLRNTSHYGSKMCCEWKFTLILTWKFPFERKTTLIALSSAVLEVVLLILLWSSSIIAQHTHECSAVCFSSFISWWVCVVGRVLE